MNSTENKIFASGRTNHFRIPHLLLFLLTFSWTNQVSSQAVSDSTVQEILSFQSPVDASRYLIYPGQQLTITFLQSTLSPLRLEVNADGAIVHPSFGKVEVGGEVVSLAALRAKLLNHLKTFFKLHEIDVTVTRPLNTTVEVVGDVKSPGSYRLSNALTMADLIDSAGGILPGGSHRSISVIGVDSQNCDLLRGMTFFQKNENPYLYGIRRVIVPKSDPRVRIEGDVVRSGEVEFKSGETLESLFPFVGGLIGNTDIAVSESGTTIQLPHALTASSSGKTFVVHTQKGQAVSLNGALRSPQSAGKPEQTLQQALTSSGGFTPMADSSRVVIWRKMTTPTDQSLLRYPLVFTREFFAATQIMAGDSVVVPKRQRVVQIVEGERAQAIPYQKIMTVRDLLSLAGKKNVSEVTHDLTIRDGATGLEISAQMTSQIFDGDRLIIAKKENRP